MDYSKLTPEQLLEILKTQSPEMYSALTEPISSPGHWSDGENPMDYYSNSMSDVLNRGYDPNLIVNRALSGPNLFDDNDQNRILFQLDQIGTGLVHPDNGFPSDNVDSVMRPFTIAGEEYNDSLEDIMSNLTSEDYEYFPAAASAQAILADNRQIGDSDYTIDDLRANGMSDEQLLEFLRNLTNKGYKI